MAYPAAAQSQDLNKLVANAVQYLSNGNYAEAEPLLQRIIRELTFLVNDNERAAYAVEMSYFYLGYIEFEKGNAGTAMERFDGYLKAFPDGKFAVAARIMRLEVLALKQDWETLEREASRMLNLPSLTYEDKVGVLQLLADAAFRTQDWGKATGFLEQLLTRARNPQVLEQAAAMMGLALLEQERYDDLLSWYPRLRRQHLAFNIEFNIALVDHADRLVENDEFRMALLFYRMVRSREELLQHLQNRLYLAREELKNLKPVGSQEQMTAQARRVQFLRDRVAQFEDTVKVIEEYPPYKLELLLRTGNAYYRLGRYLEAITIFERVIRESDQPNISEMAQYSLYSCYLAIEDYPRALEEGRNYVKQHPEGSNRDGISLSLTQVMLQLEEYDKLSSFSQQLLEIFPNHSYIDQLYYTTGLAYFQQEEFDAAILTFREGHKRFPNLPTGEACAYYIPLCHMFTEEFEKAEQEFRDFLTAYPDGFFHIDVRFRIAVCLYGQGRTEEAEAALRAFQQAYPESDKTWEVNNMLADILAEKGLLDEALGKYRSVIEGAKEMAQVNYAASQSCRVYELEQRWDDIINLWQDYLDRFGLDGNFTTAYYWMGTAQSQKGRKDLAEELFFEAITKYGNNPKHYGIDMIIRDLVAEYQGKGEQALKNQFMNRLFKELDRAQETHQTTLWLRLLTMFAETSPERDLRFARILFKQPYHPHAAPITLDWIVRKTDELGDHELGRKVSAYFLEHYPESDLVMNAMKNLAQYRIEDGKYDEARALLTALKERFPSAEIAGWAQKSMADIYFQQGSYDAAEELYKTIMSVREWRGPLWAEALYQTGMCLFNSGRQDESFAMFQRVYVMYEGYPEWAARAYLMSGKCLELAGKKDEAIATYQEMLDKEALKYLPESKEVRARLKDLGGGA